MGWNYCLKPHINILWSLFVPTPKVKNVCEAWLHIEDTGNIIAPSQKVMKKLLK